METNCSQILALNDGKDFKYCAQLYFCIGRRRCDFFQGNMTPQKILEQMQSAAEDCSNRKFVLSIADRRSLARQLTNYYCCYLCNLELFKQ